MNMLINTVFIVVFTIFVCLTLAVGTVAGLWVIGKVLLWNA